MSEAERFDALRARLEAKREELLKAINALDRTERLEGKIGDGLFLLLGVVTFWQTLPQPSEFHMDQVNKALDGFRVEVRFAS